MNFRLENDKNFVKFECDTLFLRYFLVIFEPKIHLFCVILRNLTLNEITSKIEKITTVCENQKLF